MCGEVGWNEASLMSFVVLQLVMLMRSRAGVHKSKPLHGSGHAFEYGRGGAGFGRVRLL